VPKFDSDLHLNPRFVPDPVHDERRRAENATLQKAENRKKAKKTKSLRFEPDINRREPRPRDGQSFTKGG
jgi:hypothetical protein